jgi:hypothetical protein
MEPIRKGKRKERKKRSAKRRWSPTEREKDERPKEESRKERRTIRHTGLRGRKAGKAECRVGGGDRERG